VNAVDPEKLARQVLEAALRAGAEAADALCVEGDVLEARVRGAEIEFVKQARERRLGLRAFASGPGGLRTAVTSTSDLAADAIERLAQEAVALARATAPDPAAGLPTEPSASDLPDLELFEPGDHPFDAAARIAHARAAEAAAREVDPRIRNSEGSSIHSEFMRIAFASSRGFAGGYERAHHSLASEPLASQDGSMQRDWWMTVGRRLRDLEPPEAVGRRAARGALARLGARRVPTCEVPVIFDARSAASLVRQLAGCATGSSVYRGTTYLADKLGERIASDLVTLIDDGRKPGGLASRPFDGEGLPTRRNVLVGAGVLTSWLLDSYSARKLGMTSTGSALRGASGAPSPGPSNLWLEPGGLTPEDLIASTPRGLLVTELIGMGFNPVSGDYSRGAAGFWIEGGELAHPVEEITIAGSFPEMLAGIDAVADDLLWLGPVAAPSLRIARMTVAGA
jgi:PmbA protein